MSEHRFEEGRFFIKDLVRLHVDFAHTSQSRNLCPPPLQEVCPGDHVRVALPAGRESLERVCRAPLGPAIAQRESVRAYSAASLSLEELSALLWATQGVRRKISEECALRAVPSAGARHPFETYVAVTRVESLEPGLYRYLPFDNELDLVYLDADIGRRASLACHGQLFVARAAVTFFWTAIPARTEWRYGEAAHKVIALDAGHVCQNLYLAAGGIGGGACAVAAYDQVACDDLLKVDGEEEFTIYIAAMGKR